MPSVEKVRLLISSFTGSAPEARYCTSLFFTATSRATTSVRVLRKAGVPPAASSAWAEAISQPPEEKAVLADSAVFTGAKVQLFLPSLAVSRKILASLITALSTTTCFFSSGSKENFNSSEPISAICGFFAQEGLDRLTSLMMSVGISETPREASPLTASLRPVCS